MERLRLGQVIDQMQLGEVAVKVSGIFDGRCCVEGHDYLRDGLFFDENDHNILKSFEGNEITIAKGNNKAESSLFIIMSKEEYNRMIANGRKL